MFVWSSASKVMPAAFLLSWIANGTLGAEPAPPIATVAYPANFYLQTAIAIELTGNELAVALSGVSGRGADGIRVRVLRPPTACNGIPGEVLWAGLAGAEAEYGLEATGRDGTSFFQAVIGIDFGKVELINGQLWATWYECPGATVYAMFRDVDARHFMLTDDGEPFLAWSAARL